MGYIHPAHILANGKYTVLVTAAGTGFSHLGQDALTLWSGDGIGDPQGFFIYLRDVGRHPDENLVWSAGWRPVPGTRSGYGYRWQPGRFEITREEHGITSRLEICVPADETAELRRLTLVNRSDRRRVLEWTSYAEIVLQVPELHAAHPVFSKLFLQTEYVPEQEALLASRRPRASGEWHPWLVHARVGSSAGEGVAEFETDRARFLGRGTLPDLPHALSTSEQLSGTTGDVLDPILSLRGIVTLEPGEQKQVTLLLGAESARDDLLAMTERFETDHQVQAAFAGAEAQAGNDLERFALSTQEAEYYQALVGAMLYGHPGLRATPQILQRARGDLTVGLVDLARHGLDDRRAWVVLQADQPAGATLCSRLLKAHHYWQSLGLPVDLVIVTRDESVVTLSATEGSGDPPIVLRREDLSPAEMNLLDAAARLVVVDGLPDLAELAADVPPAPLAKISGRPVAQSVRHSRDASGESSPTSLRFFNGYGGFSAHGHEYVIRLSRRQDGTLHSPPQPWINVIANEDFGFLVSETGAGYTWHGNSREHRLTPWANDPVRDPHGEALYLRDEESGAFWSPLPGPTLGAGDYEMRHGHGYSRCHHECAGLVQDTILFVPRHDPVKITRVRLTNTSGRKRSLSLFAYQRLVLGALPETSGRFVVTETGPEPGDLRARNRAAGVYADNLAFASVLAPEQAGAIQVTADAAAFLGHGGQVASPAALTEAASLDGATGAGLDPCFAQHVSLELDAGETTEVVFLFGEVSGNGTVDPDAVRRLTDRFRSPAAVTAALDEVQEFWRHGLSGVQITTPAVALDILVNGWLPYQTLSCRMWGRSALYQSGGAFGYRDQLQDAGSLVYLWPALTRAQILLHAAHQFRSGDVLHWWHPPANRGLRTRFADDLLWLPYMTCHYLQTTGDHDILDETAPFLTAPALAPGEDEVFLQPEDSGESADLYEHCCRALDRSLTTGEHGLPLFGCGDWNDGMNRVGHFGRGESVWMGFFLCSILEDFAAICDSRRDGARARRYRAHHENLREALNEAGWDGAWYRRGYYDDGSPLGSRESDECRIDALAQAWSVLSGVAPPERASRAMAAVEEHLISQQDGLIRLLTPPFRDTPHDPGYIKGYVAGVRENGGQYTHAALWVVRAMAELGRNDRVASLLELLNPLNHARNANEVAVYRVEPYVVAADVYGEPPHVGRGGWTWYTGSSGWMYRVALESLLGFRLMDGDTLVMKPCIPDDWPQFEITYRLPDTVTTRENGETSYEIHVVNPDRCARRVVDATCDGEPLAIMGGACHIPLQRDSVQHRVELVLGPDFRDKEHDTE